VSRGVRAVLRPVVCVVLCPCWCVMGVLIYLRNLRVLLCWIFDFSPYLPTLKCLSPPDPADFPAGSGGFPISPASKLAYSPTST